MANTIRDAKSAALGGVMDVKLALQEFQQSWFAPEVRRAKAAIEQGLVDQWDAHQAELQQIQATNPQGYERARSQIEALRKK